MEIFKQQSEQFQIANDASSVECSAAQWARAAEAYLAQGKAKPEPGRMYLLLKRGLDIAIAVPLTILLLPIFAVLSVLVRITSEGPALFRQERIGMNGEVFTIFKFRSMFVNADPGVHRAAVERFFNGEQLTPNNKRTPYKLTGDARITKVGAMLRKMSLDELPQLFNVIRGDMSLVGPRPALAYEVARYSMVESLRLSVPQGMTGLWQVRGRGRVSYGQALLLDLEYVRCCSLLLDCKILFLTLPAVIIRRHGI